MFLFKTSPIPVVVGILIFVAGMWYGGYVARREVEKMAVGQSASNVQAPTPKPNEAI